MVLFYFSNGANSTIADNPLSSVATTINVSAGNGSKFPTEFPFLITMWDGEIYSNPNSDPNMEICKCTAVSTDALTVVRGQEGTSGVQHNQGSRIANLITAEALNGIKSEVEARIETADKGIANGVPELDSNGKVPLTQLPDVSKMQTYVVETIVARDALTDLITGEKCFITNDGTNTGDSYIWDGTSWELLADADWENVNLEWANINSKPTSIVNDIDDAVTKKHSHGNKALLDTYSQTEANIADAVTKKHNHANQTEIDLITDGDHDVRTDNPHGVTASQVGLGSVTNEAQVPLTQKDALNGVAALNSNGDLLSKSHKLYLYLDVADNQEFWDRTNSQLAFLVHRNGHNDYRMSIHYQDGYQDILHTGNFGTGAGTICEGNDSRLSDARTPTSHTHTESEITDLGSYALDTHNHDSDYLGLTAKAADSNLLDGYDNLSFMLNRGTLAADSDWNTVTTVGFYKVAESGGWAGTTNTPTDAYSYGTLIVTASGNIVTQTYIPHSTGSIWARNKYNTDDWLSWKEELNSNNYTNYLVPKTGGTFTGNVTIPQLITTGTAGVILQGSVPEIKFEESGETDYYFMLMDGGGFSLRYGTNHGASNYPMKFDSGKWTFDGRTAGNSTTIDILSNDSGESILNLMGDGIQGTGLLFVGQTYNYGGGLVYHGDSTPSDYGEGTDYVTLFRRDAGTNYWTARNKYNSNDWEFRNDVDAVSFTENGTLLVNKYLARGQYNISNRDMYIYSKRAMVGLDTLDGDKLYLNYAGDFGNGLEVQSNLSTTGDMKVYKSDAWLTLDSPSTGDNYTEQSAGISIGENGYKGSAAVHMTYTGDGYGHIGMGAVTNGKPAYEALELYYTANHARFKGGLGIGGVFPTGNLANGKAIAIGDSDTGIRQNGDGVLELWANNQEIAQFTTSQVNLYKNLEMGNRKVTGVATPTVSDDAANKQYVDDNAGAGADVHSGETITFTSKYNISCAAKSWGTMFTGTDFDIVRMHSTDGITYSTSKWRYTFTDDTTVEIPNIGYMDFEGFPAKNVKKIELYNDGSVDRSAIDIRIWTRGSTIS